MARRDGVRRLPVTQRIGKQQLVQEQVTVTFTTVPASRTSFTLLGAGCSKVAVVRLWNLAATLA